MTVLVDSRLVFAVGAPLGIGVLGVIVAVVVSRRRKALEATELPRGNDPASGEPKAPGMLEALRALRGLKATRDGEKKQLEASKKSDPLTTKGWPTVSGYPSSMRQPLPEPSLSTLLFGQTGVPTDSERNPVRVFAVGALAITIVGMSFVILTLFPHLSALYGAEVWAFLLGSGGQAVKYGIVIGCLTVSVWLTVFKVLRVPRRRS